MRARVILGGRTQTIKTYDDKVHKKPDRRRKTVRTVSGDPRDLWGQKRAAIPPKTAQNRIFGSTSVTLGVMTARDLGRFRSSLVLFGPWCQKWVLGIGVIGCMKFIPDTIENADSHGQAHSQYPSKIPH